MPATIYNTPAGRTLVKRILNGHKKPIEPHDYQLEGICRLLDGEDVLVTTATGTGKTGLFIFLMVVICAIAADPTLALEDRTFPKDPAMLVVCPTKALQSNLVSLHSNTGTGEMT